MSILVSFLPKGVSNQANRVALGSSESRPAREAGESDPVFSPSPTNCIRGEVPSSAVDGDGPLFCTVPNLAKSGVDGDGLGACRGRITRGKPLIN
jgi:hypothetical protein